jgi:CubicO group peptidase (beta-lactamase class C family)
MRALAWGLASLLPAQSKPDQAELIVGKPGEAIAAAVRATAEHGFSGAVLAADQGKIVAAFGVGFADAERKRPNTATTLFEIASATKQFTAAAILVLQQDKKLKLDDVIGKHLPGVPEHSRALTLRQLLQHTTGIPGERTSGGSDDLRKSIAAFLAEPPMHPPGSRFAYWNPGYALLAGVIETVSGKDYMRFCKQRLFEPAGMASACFTGDKCPRGVTAAIGSEGGRTRSALDHPYGSYGYQYRGMGGAVCNVFDLWRWDRALHGDKVLQAAAKRELFAPGLEDYALGWRVRTSDQRTVQEHGGDVQCFHTEMRRYPDQERFLVVLTNNDGKWRREVADTIDAILSDQPSPIVPKELKELLAGEYHAENGGKLTMVSEGPFLQVTWHWPAGMKSYGLLIGSELEGLQWREPDGTLHDIRCKKMERIEIVTIQGTVFRRR